MHYGLVSKPVIRSMSHPSSERPQLTILIAFNSAIKTSLFCEVSEAGKVLLVVFSFPYPPLLGRDIVSLGFEADVVDSVNVGLIAVERIGALKDVMRVLGGR